ncbi:hypothetical protein C2E31_18155 [Rhodopirellula baltica]|nr:hypothetical protein C2E31_18155 [Rhodopirellula baltica]
MTDTQNRQAESIRKRCAKGSNTEWLGQSKHDCCCEARLTRLFASNDATDYENQRWKFRRE